MFCITKIDKPYTKELKTNAVCIRVLYLIWSKFMPNVFLMVVNCIMFVHIKFTKPMETTKTIAKVNQVSILMVENEEKLVPIKPICEALGIDDKTQRDKINTDEILNSVGGLSTSTGSDGKRYEMFCLPLKFTFGWLFTINSKNVAPEAKESVIKYKLECYEALYRHFTDHTNFMEQKQKIVKEKREELAVIKRNFSEAKSKLADANKCFNDAIDYPFEQWLANDRQLTIKFD